MIVFVIMLVLAKKNVYQCNSQVAQTDAILGNRDSFWHANPCGRVLAWSLYGVFPGPLGQCISVTYRRARSDHVTRNLGKKSPWSLPVGPRPDDCVHKQTQKLKTTVEPPLSGHP